MFDFSKPVWVASGPWDRPAKSQTLGAYVSKTVTRHPRFGNPERSFCRVAGGGYLNWVGLQNLGEADYRKQIFNDKQSNTAPTIASIWADSLEDWAYLATSLTGWVSGLELNVSCPNASLGWNDPPRVETITRIVRNRTDLPLTVKLPPDPNQIVAMVLAAERAGANAVTISNTLKATHFDGTNFVEGGLSGTPLKPVSLYCVRKAAEKTSLSIIGCGGVRDELDVEEYLLAGASAVQVGSAHLENPNVSVEIAQDLESKRGQ